MPRGPIDFDLLNSLEPDALFEELCRQFEAAWRAGQAPSIESILARLPMVDCQRLVTTLAVQEFRLRQSLGEMPKVNEYVHRFPKFATELSSRLSASLVPSNGPVGSTVNLADSAYGRKLVARANLRKTGIGRYRVDDELGMGSSGEVWKGYDADLRRPVAIKLLRADRSFGPDAERNFLDEGRKLAQLKHHGIVAIYDVGMCDGNYFLVSEYVDGGTLDERIKQSRLSVNDTIRIIAEIAEALHYAHTHGFVHRDVKPQNILLAKDGTARLADFGMAVTEEQQLLEEASVRGTLSYMAPEQLRGDSHLADARSDIYSLGAVLYLMLAGRLPFLATSLSQLREQALNREPRPLRTINDKLSPELELICLKCLRLRPGDRYTTALDLARDLREIIESKQERKPHPGWLAISAALLALVAIGWAIFANWTSLPADVLKKPGNTLKDVSSLSPVPDSKSVPVPASKNIETFNVPLLEATVAADGSAQFRTINDALNAIAAHGTIRILDQATYPENLNVSHPLRHQGITIDGSAGATLTSATSSQPIIEIHGVHRVRLRKLKFLISDSEHAVMVTGGAEGAKLESLKITQPNSKATAALQIFTANGDAHSPELVITDCDIESYLSGQSLWIHAEPSPVHNLVVTGNRFRSRGKSSLVVMQGILHHAVIKDNKFVGGHTGLNLYAFPSTGPAVEIVGNKFYGCDCWIGLMSTKPALTTVTLANNLVLACPLVDINESQLADVQKYWTLAGNCWERDPREISPDSGLAALAKFHHEIEVKSRDPREVGFLEPVGELSCEIPVQADLKQ